MTHRKLRRAACHLLLAPLLLLTSGCVVYEPEYVIKTGGHFIASWRCSEPLVRVAVALKETPRDPNTMWPTVALWEAVADEPGVDRFVLFETGQPGVTVTHSDLPDNLDSLALAVMVRSDRHVQGMLFYPGQMAEGTVSWEAGGGPGQSATSAEEFFKMSSGVFGCPA